MKSTRSTSTVLPSQKSRVGVVIAKDGGWGWVVVFAAFMVCMLSVGLIYSLGILLTEFTKYFNESKSVIAWIASIAIGTSSLIGPIVCGLTNRYGCRLVALAGAVLTCTGMLLSMPAQNVFHLFFTIGAVVGSGVGMMYLPSIIIVNSYFENKRALATGISMCGSSVGTFIMTPLTECILSYYGSWRSTVLILAGIMLNGMVFGSLYRPPNVRVLPADVSQEEENCQRVLIFEPIPEIQEEYLAEEAAGWEQLFVNRMVYRTQSEPTHVKNCKRMPMKKAHSALDFEILEPQGSGTMHPGHSSTLPHQLTVSKSERDTEVSKTTFQKIHSYKLPSRIANSRTSRGKFSTSGLLYRKDIFYTASLLTVKEYRDNPPEYYEALVTSVVETGGQQRKCRELWDAVAEMMGLSLLGDKAFQMILLSRFVASLAITVPYFFFVDRALDIDISNGSYLISIIGIGNLFGRLTLGFLSDYGSVNRILLYKICMAICGVTIAASGFCYTFTTMAAVSAIYGFTIGSFTAMLPVILVDLLGIAKLTNAFGLLVCCQGIANIVGLPLAGLVRDLTGSYMVGFLSSGILVISSGLIWCFVPVVVKTKHGNTYKKKRARAVSDSADRS